MRRVLVPPHVPDIAPFSPRRVPVVSLAGNTMGTTWSVKFAAHSGVTERDLLHVIEARLGLVVAQMSQWDPESDLSRFNRAQPGSLQILPQAFFGVLRAALDLARETGGAYDPALGALIELWGFGAAGRRMDIPAQTEIERARASAGWSRLFVDDERRAVRQPGGVHLDLSSIAKGFAVDLVSGMLTQRGIADHLVEIGGELRGSGTKPDQSPWWVALDGVQGASGETIVALHGLSVATSGDAQRFIAVNGRKFSHTIDPRTGWPIPDNLASVTVLDRSCMRADALATALSVLGAERGYAFASARDIAARFLLRGPGGIRERTTPAFAAMADGPA
ncbi:MAG: FAD:protein FMN transferase [Pseudorhodoplanes sp.]|uniref:FAD:protein FMN transferase n=1 Tax=Pseudorhodoplanes sp. TaxID=1934341 RepID=UPI003D111398